MTPERSAELAKQMGLDKTPALRYERAPDENAPLERVVNFKKALQCVDVLRTAAFERFIPDCCVIDMEIGTAVYCEGMNDAVLIRTDVPPPLDPSNPTNLKITKATGIPHRLDDQAFFIWLGKELELRWTAWGARRMGPPLVFWGRGDPNTRDAKPFIGLLMKFARNVSDVPADWGAIIPPGMSIKEANRRLTLAAVDNGSRIAETDTRKPHGGST